MTLLTIGIPTFNRASSVRDKLEQLAPLLGPEVSLLLVNNGSTDGTAALLDDAAKTNPRVQVFHNRTNLGCDANYLRVLEMASGTWCWLLGDDEPLDLASFPALLERLRAETADTIHMVRPGFHLAPDAVRFFNSAPSFVEDFYHLPTFHSMSCNLYRTDAARPYLRSAYGAAGLMHAYSSVGFELMQSGAGLRLYDLPLLRSPDVTEPAAGAGAPRWPVIDGHLGAWQTLRRAIPRSVRSRIDVREAEGRAHLLTRAATLDLLGAGNGSFRVDQLRRMFELFPVQYYGGLAMVLLAWGASRVPPVGARLVQWGARRTWHERWSTRLRELYGLGQDDDLTPAIEAAIERRRTTGAKPSASHY